MPGEEILGEATRLVTAAGGAAGVGWMGRRLLGPLLDDIAEGWRKRHERFREQNFERIVEKAAEKLGDAQLESAGAVHPRVGQVILEEGSWCDDDLTQEYFAGVLATSRTPEGSDDRGLTWARLVSGLSSVQIRAHYVAYARARRLLFEQSSLNVGYTQDLERYALWIPRPDIDQALGLGATPSRLVDYAFRGLHASGLVGKYAIGSASTLKGRGAIPHGADIPDGGGVVYALSPLGIELFLWAHGLGDLQVHAYVDAEYTLALAGFEQPVADACLVQALPSEAQTYGGGGGEEE